MLHVCYLLGLMIYVCNVSLLFHVVDTEEKISRDSRVHIGRFCLISSAENYLFLGTNTSIIIISITNEHFIHDKVTWPTIQTESVFDLRYNHCNSVIQSVVRLAPGTFEVCGRSLMSIRCNILAKKDLIWSTFSGNTAPFDLKYKDLFYDYSDGYLTLASSSDGYSPRLEVKKLKLLEDQMNLPKEIIMHTSYDVMENSNYNAYTNNYHLLLSNSMYWDKLLETNNLKNSHFTEGYEFTFKKILSLPGRRYIVFREPAIETQLRENPWTSDRKIVYTRIARICTEDKGFQMPDDGRKLFTSFFKTRLVCQVRSKMQTKYRISSTNRDFNYLVSLSTSYSPEMSNDLILYGLFSSRDPQLDDELPANLANNLVFSGPLALCIYKLSTVDKTIESSDLIMRLPSFFPYHLRDTSSSSSFENHSNVNIESYISGRVAPRLTGGFKRINRDKYPQLKNITKCPGSYASNKRLALEASLLVDSVYPERLDIVGLIETRSRISAFTIDPRHVSKVYKDKTQPNQIRHIRYTIFYIGTNNGDVFKMLLFNEVEDNFSQHSTSATNRFLGNHSLDGFTDSMYFNTPYSSSSIVSTGNIRFLRHLTTLTTNEKITDLLFIYNSFLNRTTEIISSDKQFTYSAMDKFFLLVFNQADIIQVEVTQCDRFKTCKECVALKDPDCYWNEILQKCDTSTDGLSNIITGFHVSCEDLDVDKSKIHFDVKRVSSPITSNTSELLSNTPVKRQCPFENERITHYVLKLLFSGFIGVIIGFIIGVVLLLIIQKFIKLNKSKCRNVIILNSKNQTERSLNDICSSVSDQNMNLLQHSKQGTVCSHSKYPACLTPSTMNNEQLLMPQMNNTHDPCDYLSHEMKFIANNEKQSFPLSEQALASSLPLWDDKIYMMSIDGKTNTNPVTKIMNNQYISNDRNTSQVINTFSSNNDNYADNFDEFQQYKVAEPSSKVVGRTFQKIK
uniref:Sema domain-containing protein n=1 Tax=Trichobilharzia regenti TaxID=157069 RepID=A0AA85KGV2_TRIRE|nr:unnamed protein product [Trichobilharzia regenti]